MGRGHSFNPRPPISQRATGQGVETGAVTAGVSIHARQFHSGRRASATASTGCATCFNPRPPISQRATAAWLRRQAQARRFNPRPPISQRATMAVRKLSACIDVSIHARQFHSGRPWAAADAVAHALFQSTPANFTAGDGLDRHRLMRQQQVRFQSTPANFTAGDGARAAMAAASSVFQSTPANFTAGDVYLTPRNRAIKRFNPRPPISQRATRGDCSRCADPLVSIHARQFHSGRPAGSRVDRADREFQSTPANFTAGDCLQPGRCQG